MSIILAIPAIIIGLTWIVLAFCVSGIESKMKRNNELLAEILKELRNR
jgi:hypothetical protein